MSKKTMKLTELPIGESITGILLDLPESKYGFNVLMEVDGEELLIFPAGSVKKYLAADVAAGTKQLGLETTITRTDDRPGTYQGRAYVATTFVVKQNKNNVTALTAAPAAKVENAANSKEAIKAAIEAAKAKRAEKA